MKTIALFTTTTPQPGRNYVNIPIHNGQNAWDGVVKVRAQVVADLDAAHDAALPTETVLNTIDIG